ncbi:MAG TPA: hypothetical protein VMA54_03410 [Steroidobacteraceae bacterium]|nr:hypothetical protein [Steroidobacteraceae bacterium]
MSADEIEYEVEAVLDQETFTLHFHPRCYDVWRAGRERPAAESLKA